MYYVNICFLFRLRIKKNTHADLCTHYNVYASRLPVEPILFCMIDRFDSWQKYYIDACVCIRLSCIMGKSPIEIVRKGKTLPTQHCVFVGSIHNNKSL